MKQAIGRQRVGEERVKPCWQLEKLRDANKMPTASLSLGQASGHRRRPTKADSAVSAKTGDTTHPSEQ